MHRSLESEIPGRQGSSLGSGQGSVRVCRVSLSSVAFHTPNYQQQKDLYYSHKLFDHCNMCFLQACEDEVS